jgi:isocitrate dehydrogenase (NAD+)
MIRRAVTLLTGDGIGPELCAALRRVVSAASIPLDFEEFNVQTAASNVGVETSAPDALKSLRRNGLGLVGPYATAVARGHVSLTRSLQTVLGLFVNVRHCRTVRAAPPYAPIDVFVLRELTEGYYKGLEHLVLPGVAESLKVVTDASSNKISEFAFAFASKFGRKRVTAAHKANVMSPPPLELIDV